MPQQQPSQPGDSSYIMETAGEGGAWGIAVLAAFLAKKKDGQSLGEFLNEELHILLHELLKALDILCHRIHLNTLVSGKNLLIQELAKALAVLLLSKEIKI